MNNGKNGKNRESGEIEVSGFFDTGWRGEGEEEIPEKTNLGWFLFAIFLVAGIFFLRVSYLQIVKGNYYKGRAEKNRVKEVLMAAPRGIIYDRNHKVLANNKPKFDLVLVPGLLPKNLEDRLNVFKLVAYNIGYDPNELEEKYRDVDPDSYSPVLLKENLEREEALALEIALVDWPGVLVQKTAKRVYPAANSAAHLIGYNGRISEAELKQRPNYLLSDIIGKEGIEQIYESDLRGEKGSLQFEIDSVGKSKRIVGSKDAVIGKGVVLNVDLDINQVAHKALKEETEKNAGKGGAVVAINPQNGELLALTSYPSYDSNEFNEKLSPERFQEFFQSEKYPLFNRATAGIYPPGSTFKPLVAAAALEKRIVTPTETIDCPEVIQVGKWSFSDWKYHGLTDLNKAIAESVNPYFYIIGGGWGDRKGLGPENIKYYASQVGLGKVLGVDIPQEASGLIPDSEWKEKTKNEKWYIGDTYHLAIGQGNMLITPLQLASYISALVNGGTLFAPRVVDYVENVDGSVLRRNKPEVIRKGVFSKSTLEAVKRAMSATVSSAAGSARTLQGLENKYGIKIGGKTGTAQTEQEDKYHAWFVGFAPEENPEIVVAALVEKGGEGYSTALPVAEKVLDEYFAKRGGRLIE
jgi:penicillin-binding protein 2